MGGSDDITPLNRDLLVGQITIDLTTICIHSASVDWPTRRLTIDTSYRTWLVLYSNCTVLRWTRLSISPI